MWVNMEIYKNDELWFLCVVYFLEHWWQKYTLTSAYDELKLTFDTTSGWHNVHNCFKVVYMMVPCYWMVLFCTKIQIFQETTWLTFQLLKATSLIARSTGPTWGPSGADRTQVGPCWPHEPCYLGLVVVHMQRTSILHCLVMQMYH